MYRGPTTAGTMHRHAAFQIMIGMRDDGRRGGRSRRHPPRCALVVSPMQRHCLLATADVLTYFVEPHCAFADRLRERYGDGITAAPELADLTEDDVRPAGSRGSDDLDPRLVLALNALAGSDIALPDLATQIGLSPQRLRALARQQLGMPLARWRVWTRLRRAAEALQQGQSLADAATEAGFADQAHLTPADARDDGTHAGSTASDRAQSVLARDIDGDRTAHRRYDLGLADVFESALGQQIRQHAVGVRLGVLSSRRPAARCGTPCASASYAAARSRRSPLCRRASTPRVSTRARLASSGAGIGGAPGWIPPCPPNSRPTHPPARRPCSRASPP